MHISTRSKTREIKRPQVPSDDNLPFVVPTAVVDRLQVPAATSFSIEEFAIEIWCRIVLMSHSVKPTCHVAERAPNLALAFRCRLGMGMAWADFVVCVSNSACGVGCEIVGSRAISCREAGLVHVSLEELLSKCRVSQCNITLLDSGLLKWEDHWWSLWLLWWWRLLDTIELFSLLLVSINWQWDVIINCASLSAAVNTAASETTHNNIGNNTTS